jgi:prevent-host-death family protein
MQQTLSITDARDKLMQIANELESHAVDLVVISKRGRPAMAVLPYDVYESIIETLEILSDEEQLAALRESMREAAADEVEDFDDVLAELGW